jgi:hypothetical protein
MSFKQVLSDNDGDVFFGKVGIPDSIRIDNDVGAVAALVQTAALIDPDDASETRPGDLLLEALVDLDGVAIQHRTVRA